MLEILKANVLIAYQQLEQYQLDRYGRGVVSAIDRNRDMVVIKTAQQSVHSSAWTFQFWDYFIKVILNQ